MSAKGGRGELHQVGWILAKCLLPHFHQPPLPTTTWQNVRGELNFFSNRYLRISATLGSNLAVLSGPGWSYWSILYHDLCNSQCNFSCYSSSSSIIILLKVLCTKISVCISMSPNTILLLFLFSPNHSCVMQHNGSQPSFLVHSCLYSDLGRCCLYVNYWCQFKEIWRGCTELVCKVRYSPILRVLSTSYISLLVYIYFFTAKDVYIFFA